MKLTKKAISIALAIVMAVSALAVTTITSFAEESDYDENIIVSYDEFINDYSYGTGATATWPRQLTFNQDGWMRFQSRTAEEVAAKPDGSGEGYYEQQWQYRGIATPEYDEQFHNAVGASLDNGMGFRIYLYVKSAELALADDTYDKNAYVELQCSFRVRYDSNEDGVLDATDDVISIAGTPRTSINGNYGFRWIDNFFSTMELADAIDAGLSYKLEEMSIFAQNYTNEKSDKKNSKGQYLGLGNLDVVMSPCYTKTLPGFDDYNGDNIATFDASTQIDFDSFTKGLDFNTSDWTWTTENVNDVEKTKYQLGNIKRDENNYPIRANGSIYKPTPVGYKAPAADKITCSNIAASNVTETSMTVTWDSNVEATNYQIRVSDAAGNTVLNKQTTAKSYDVTGLSAATSYKVEVRAYNGSAWGDFASATLTTLGGSVTQPSTAPTTNAPAPTTKAPAATPTTVKPAAVMSTSAKPVAKLAKGKKMITVKISKKVANAQGYQIQYSTNKKFKKAKTKTLAASKSSLKIKKLKAKTKYYVRVRAYSTVNGQKVYSKWSKTLNTKTK
ncbi:MAG: fibronectin type III domain-containing protein [Acutalibacteraceae bacterium]